MSLVVVEHVPDHLVEHGEEGIERPETSEVHNVFQRLSILQHLHHQTVRGKVRQQQVGTMVLDLRGKEVSNRGILHTCRW